MDDSFEPTRAPCRVITSRDLMTLYPQPLYSYNLCQHAARSRTVSDGKRQEVLPVCSEHWEGLFGDEGQPAFTIDSALPSEPVIEPHWIV
jgi:hypothetical protein